MNLSFPSVDDSRQSSGLRLFVKGSNERLKRLLVIYVSSLKGEDEKSFMAHAAL